MNYKFDSKGILAYGKMSNGETIYVSVGDVILQYSFNPPYAFIIACFKLKERPENE